MSVKIDFSGDTWEAYFDLDDRVEIYKNGRPFDVGQYDGQLIHDTRRTPEEVLEALESHPWP